MADKTFTIIDEATGKKVGEQTLSDDYAPVLMQGQRAELAEKPKAETKKAADKAE
jgi:hypothetical protein